MSKRKLTGRARRHRRVRKKIVGTGDRPRLCVFRSLKHIYAQVIDDESGRCLCAVSSLSKEVREQLAADKDLKGKKGVSTVVGKVVAEKAQAAGITTVAFDRGGYLYHGRVRVLADSARKAGLKF